LNDFARNYPRLMETEYDASHRLGVCLKFPVRVVMTVALAVSAL
jgi:hypothetical protein